MSQNYVVPSIYQDMSNQSQGYFAFRFRCQECSWSVDTNPIRSTVTTTQNIVDIGAGLIGGFWGHAVEMGEKLYSPQWHNEQAKALQHSWSEIQHTFRLCSTCHRTVCLRCFNVQVHLCTHCAPDLRADGAQYQHHLTIDAQREQIQQQYKAPQFDVHAIPSAATPDLLQSAPPQPQFPAIRYQQAPTPAAIAGFQTPGYPKTVPCSACQQPGTPGKFCQQCGTKIPMPDLFCPTCAAPVESTSHFCVECGATLHHG